MIRKWPEEHGRELHLRPKSLVTDKAYLSAKFGPNISDFFDPCIHWVPMVRVPQHRVWSRHHDIGCESTYYSSNLRSICTLQCTGRSRIAQTSWVLGNYLKKFLVLLGQIRFFFLSIFSFLCFEK